MDSILADPPHGGGENDDDNPGGATIPQNNNVYAALREYRRLGAHYLRYEFVNKFCSDAVIADVGCGYGFGALILNGSYREYVGVDADARAISWARQNLRTGVHGISSSISFWDVPSFYSRFREGDFDVIAALEVIEHVKHPVEFIKNIVSLLRKGGTLILSTPNGSFSRKSRALYSSQYHINEFTASQIRIMLSTVANEVRIFREDRIDRLNVLKRVLIGRLPNLVKSPSYAEKTLPLEKAFFGKYLNGPRFWCVREIEEHDFSTNHFSNILAVARKSSR